VAADNNHAMGVYVLHNLTNRMLQAAVTLHDSPPEGHSSLISSR